MTQEGTIKSTALTHQEAIFKPFRPFTHPPMAPVSYVSSQRTRTPAITLGYHSLLPSEVRKKTARA